MRELHTTALVGDDGKLTVELSTDLAPGPHRLTILVEDAGEAGPESAALARQNMEAFLADWDEPAMSAYDAL